MPNGADFLTGAAAHQASALSRSRSTRCCVAATLYYLVFYRSRLIPRWLSVWGLVGTTLGAVAGVLVLFQVVDVMSGVQVVLNVPIGVQEMVLAVWLLVKGFSAPASPPAAWRDPLIRQHL